MATRGPLPLMKSIAEAKALVERERDPFYLDAFMFEAWLGSHIWESAREYAEKKCARNRKMQTGQAWRGFLDLFGHVRDTEYFPLLSHLYRFAEYDDVQAETLRRAIIPLSFEHECFGDYIGPKTKGIAARPQELVQVARRSIERWCDWIDCMTHFETHASWHLQPAQFDPDPEKRELAALGVNQRNYADLGDFGKQWWQWHHGEAAVRFRSSPKWTALGKAMADETRKTWNYPDLDLALITCWPLLKKNNWTYRDLLEVAKQILPQHRRYPLQGEPELATYCVNVLGLRKTGTKGRSSANGKPPGWEVAMKLCSPTPESS